jgi:hypothetical protein
MQHQPFLAANYCNQVQICQPIAKSSSSNCSNPTSMVNMISEDGSCISLADARTFAFHPDPYKVTPLSPPP